MIENLVNSENENDVMELKKPNDINKHITKHMKEQKQQKICYKTFLSLKELNNYIF